MRIAKVFKKVYSQPAYILLTLALFLAYYFVSYLFVRYQSAVIVSPGPFVTYAFFAVLATSSLVSTMAIYSTLNRARKRLNVLGSTSLLSALLGSTVFSCGCSVPIFFSLATFGISSSSALSLDLAFSTYALPLMSGIALFNIFMVYYYSDRLSSQSCFRKGSGKG